MDFDAFTAGIEPGGLRTKNEIRILICYLLTSVNAPLSKDDLVEIVQGNGLANYFEVSDAISELTEKGIISSGEHSGECAAGDAARMIAKQLDTALPPTVRGKAVAAALNLLAKAKRERENRVEILRTPNGYNVVCHISGGDSDLMSFTLAVPDIQQAHMVRDNFQNSPGTVYRMLLALLTGNGDSASDFLNNREPAL